MAGAPLALVVWVLSVAERLPDPVARHRSGGPATGFSSLRTTLVLAVALSVLLSLPAAVGAVVARAPALRRCLAGFVPVFMTVLVADSLHVQVDLTDPRLAPQPETGILVASPGPPRAMGPVSRADAPTADGWEFGGWACGCHRTDAPV